MCIVSAIHDDFNRQVPQRYPWLEPLVYPEKHPGETFNVDREEFEALKKEVEALRKLLQAAKEYDKETGQPDCELEEKTEFLRKLAELLGVDLSEL